MTDDVPAPIRRTSSYSEPRPRAATDDTGAATPSSRRRERITVAHTDNVRHAADPVVVAAVNHYTAIQSTTSAADRELFNKNLQQLFGDFRKMHDLSVSLADMSAAAAEKKIMAARARLVLRVRSLALIRIDVHELVAKLRLVVEKLEDIVLLVSTRNIIRMLNENADLSTSDKSARVRVSVRDKVQGHFLRHLLDELLLEATRRLDARTAGLGDGGFPKPSPADRVNVVDPR